MELIRDLTTLEPRLRGGVLSVGVFDGVHVGHQKVLGRAVERARSLSAPAVAFTFHPHPLDFLRPEAAPPLLQTFGQKLELMRTLGIDAVVWPEAMERILAMPPESFIREVVHGALGAVGMVEGMDFRFGSGGAGDRRRLVEFASEFGFEAEFVPDAQTNGERVSSTRIRSLIAAGRVAEAAVCLGRPYTYLGTVVEGHHVGGRMGFPTANIAAPRFLTPGEGVYAGWAHLGGRRIPAAISVGRAPTFYKDHPVVVEAFLLDFEGELYGQQASLDFVEFIRPQQTFASPAALQVQMELDCRRIREVLAKAGA
jgi:riboflavin kinase/FMN adenylyltransferase